MNCFWLFPLLIALIGVFLSPLTVIQGFAPAYIANIDRVNFIHLSSWRQFVEFMGETTLYSGSTGFAVGIGVAVFDWWRNGRRDRMGIYATAALLPNIGWCLMYTGSLSLVNGLIFCAILRLINIPHQLDFLWVVPLALTGLLNLIAILWGSIRSVTSEGILTPPSLRSKIKRSSHLTG